MTAMLLDTMLGRLATYLRMCGYDTAYAGDEGIEADEVILQRTREQARTLVTRNRQLAGRAEDAILLDSRDLDGQLQELTAAGLTLELPDNPERCSICNVELVRVAPEEPTPEYAPTADSIGIWRCPACGQHFWRGSHWDNVADRLAQVTPTT